MSRAMKDSGIPWIGEIPSHWAVSRVKNCFIRKNEKAHQENPVILSLARSGVRVRDISTNEGQMAESYYDYNPVEENDLLINPMDLYSGANCSISRVKGVISPAYVNLRFTNGAVPRFYDYYFKTQYWAMALFAHGRGISFDNRWTLGVDTLFNYYIPVPSHNEQQSIADFLDKKCGEIDEMVSLQEKIIEELKAYKQSVITEAVTKGLNPDVPMKDSGINWAGKIPFHWDVSKIKNETILLDYLREPISAENRENKFGLYDYYGASGVIDKIDNYNVEGKVLLIGEDGANLLMRNLPLIYKAEGRYWVNNHAHILKVKEGNDYDYMAHLLEAGDYTLFITGSAQPKLSQDNLKNYPIPITRNKEEQKAIADYLDTKCSDIDSLISLKQSKIDALKEYKKSIIYEYVTGKKEVIE